MQSYNCADGGSGVASCAGPVANQAAIDSSTPGRKTFVVDAADEVGNRLSSSANYTILAATQSALSSTPDPSDPGQNVALTATLTSAFGSPTGTVSFFEGSVLLGSGQLDPQGHVTITLSGLAAGRHTIVASYTGEGLFASSTSKPLEQLVRVPTVVSYTGVTMLATKTSATLSATLEQTAARRSAASR